MAKLTQVRSLRRATTLAFLLCIYLFGCATPNPKPPLNPSAVATQTPTTAVAAFPNDPFQPVNGRVIPVELELPGPTRFTISETKSTLSIDHEGSTSSLRVRYWATSRRVTEEQCEQELLLLDPTAAERNRVTRDAATVSTLPFTPGTDYLGHIDSRVFADSSGFLTGYVHGVSAGLGHCVAFDARTQISRQRAEKEMGERLSLLMDRIARSLKLRAPEAREPSKVPFSPR
jgi:hypothetical protein